ncbi:MAG: hypothetical protein GFH27_549313n44 [Chloroflexi bacterium AL-W]|nr:hypothetical protein [Chloroflexi bacterium AL-N1]NOK69467.1 hypothetical protein [Chloroflexi bacterium AL-N10]NOK77432.1 hypothetical protein [Chloroflexi bacterium AL-N5]NOK84283.1 hypothetical protein [Chloroflexi bacterium AL-W]NOK91551.1 hypothetical protein [Chloroflexi bacterium AL-N15]
MFVLQRYVLLMFIGFLLIQPGSAMGNQNVTSLLNDDLEDSTDSWEFCSGASVVDITNVDAAVGPVSEGPNMLRFAPGSETCDFLGNSTAQVFHRVDIPANADGLTLSFWYYVKDVRPEVAVDGVWVRFTETTEIFDEEYQTNLLFIKLINVNNLPGWHLARTNIPANLLDEVLGQTVNLTFSLESTDTTSEDGAIYIDNINLNTGREQTTASPLPDGLQGDGSSPLVYLDTSGEMDVAVRADTDGSNAVPVAVPEELRPVLYDVQWSPNGRQLSLMNLSFIPLPPIDLDVIPAAVSILTIVDADGSNPREVLRTVGVPGIDDPTDINERPALDIIIRRLAWSPDGSKLALTQCARNRTNEMVVSDDVCQVNIINAADGERIHEIPQAGGGSWSGSDRFLFVEFLSDERPAGIWEARFEGDSVTETPVILHPRASGSFDYQDDYVSILPDRTQIATLRGIDGVTRTGEFSSREHSAITLIDAETFEARSALVIDHGVPDGPLVWSPDSSFLLYELTPYDSEQTDIWWFDVNSGETGVLIENATNPDWFGFPELSERVYLPMTLR